MARVAVVALVTAAVVVLGVPLKEEGDGVQPPPLKCAEYPPVCRAVGEVVDKSLGLCSYVLGNHITVGVLCVPAPGDKSFALQMFLEMVDSSSRTEGGVSDRLHIYLSGEGNATLHYNGRKLKRPPVHLAPESLPQQWIYLTLVLRNRELHLYRKNIPWVGVRWPLPPNSAFAEMSASGSTSASKRDVVLRVHTFSGTEITFNCAQGCPRHNATSSLIGRPFELRSRSFVLYLFVLRPADFLVVLNTTGRFKEDASIESREVIRIGGGGGGGGGGGRETSSSSSSSPGGPPLLEKGKWYELFITVEEENDGKDILKARLAGHALRQDPPVILRDAMHLRVAVMRNVEWTISCNPETEKDLLEAQKERWRREGEEEEEGRKAEEQEAEAADASVITVWTLVSVSLFGMFIVGVVICTVLRPYGGVPEEVTPGSTPPCTPANLRHGSLPTPSISLGASQQTLYLTSAGAAWSGNGGSSSGHFLTDAPRIVFSKVREAEEDWDPTAAVDPTSLEPLSISTSILTTSTTLNATRDDDDDDDDDVNDVVPKGASLEGTSYSKVKCKAGMEGGR